MLPNQTVREVIQKTIEIKTEFSVLGMKGRVLAIDLGSKNVGVAISDELGITARPLLILPRTPWKRFIASLTNLCQEFDVKTIVLGLPLGKNGEENHASLDVRKVARKIHLTLKLPVYFQDERFTSKTAEALLNKRSVGGLRRGSIKIDSEAAAIILSDYLSNIEG